MANKFSHNSVPDKSLINGLGRFNHNRMVVRGLAIIGVCLTCSWQVAAQPAIDPGVIEPRTQPPVLPQPLGDVIRVPLPNAREIPTDNSPRITVLEIVATYEELGVIDAAHQQGAEKLLQEFLTSNNNRLTIGQLDEAAMIVTDQLRADGYLLAKAIVPPQEVENNIVRVRIFAGIVGAVTADNNHLYRSDRITQPFEYMQGNPVLLKPLESRLIKLNELPGLSAIAVFKPGEQVGETQLILQTVTDQRVNYSIGVDNYGVESTGDWRLALGLQVNNLTGHRDRITVDAIKTFNPGDLRNVRVGYEITSPELVHTFGVAYSETRYDVEIASARALNIEGDTEIADAYLYSRWKNSRAFNLATQIGLSTKRAEVEFFDGGFSDGVDRLTVATASLIAEGVDERFRGLYRGSITFHKGLNGVLGSMDETGNNNSLTKVGGAPTLEGKFSKVTSTYNRLQTVSRYNSLLLLFAGQYSDDQLSSLEKMSLGGPYTVRAYPTGEFTGDRGLFSSLGWVINGGLFSDSIAFGDYGWSDILSVTVFADYSWGKNRDGSGTVERQELSGAGIGARLSLPAQQAFIDISYAMPFGGRESDNGDDGQLWLRTGIDF